MKKKHDVNVFILTKNSVKDGKSFTFMIQSDQGQEMIVKYKIPKTVKERLNLISVITALGVTRQINNGNVNLYHNDHIFVRKMTNGEIDINKNSELHFNIKNLLSVKDAGDVDMKVFDKDKFKDEYDKMNKVTDFKILEDTFYSTIGCK